MRDGYRLEACRHDGMLFSYYFNSRYLCPHNNNFSLSLGNCTMRCSTTSILAGVCGAIFYTITYDREQLPASL